MEAFLFSCCSFLVVSIEDSETTFSRDYFYCWTNLSELQFKINDVIIIKVSVDCRNKKKEEEKEVFTFVIIIDWNSNSRPFSLFLILEIVSIFKQKGIELVFIRFNILTEGKILPELKSISILRLFEREKWLEESGKWEA